MEIFHILFFVIGVPMTIITAIYAHSMYMYSRGDIAQQRGDYAEAERRFLRSATGRNFIGRGIAWAALTRVYLKMGRPDDALTSVRNVFLRTKMPSAVLAGYQLYADIALHPELREVPTRVLQEGEELLTRTRMPGPLKAMVLSQYAHAWMRLGERAEAIRLAELTLEKDAHCSPALYLRGWLHLEDNELQEAEELFRTLTAGADKDHRPLGLYGLGVAAFYGAKLKESEDFFLQAAKEGSRVLEPFAQSRLAITRSLLGGDTREPLGRAEETFHELRQTGSIKEDSEARWQLAMARAFVEGNSRAAQLAAEKAPPHTRTEALRLAERLARA